MKKKAYIPPFTDCFSGEFLSEGHLMAATVTGDTGGGPGIDDGGGGDPGDFAKESFSFDDIQNGFGYSWDEE